MRTLLKKLTERKKAELRFKEALTEKATLAAAEKLPKLKAWRAAKASK